MASVVRHTSISDRVYRDVRQAIMRGELRPGDVIREGDLTREYEMSRTPVREALFMLRFQGYLNVLPRVGYMVTELSMRDVQEAHHLRRLLELEAVRLACERITPDDLKRLERVMSSRTGDDAYADNRDFHLIIADASGSRRLSQLIGQLLDEMQRMQALDPNLAMPTGPYEHADLVEALRKRNTEEAVEAMARHVDRAMTRILERFGYAKVNDSPAQQLPIHSMVQQEG